MGFRGDLRNLERICVGLVENLGGLGSFWGNLGGNLGVWEGLGKFFCLDISSHFRCGLGHLLLCGRDKIWGYDTELWVCAAFTGGQTEHEEIPKFFPELPQSPAGLSSCTNLLSQLPAPVLLSPGKCFLCPNWLLPRLCWVDLPCMKSQTR